MPSQKVAGSDIMSLSDVINAGGIVNAKKVDVKTPKINGHKALVTDFDFCPFEDGNFIIFRCNSNRI